MGPVRSINHPLFGSLQFQAVEQEFSGAALHVLGGFENNLVTFNVPQLRGKDDARFDPVRPGAFPGDIKFHKDLKDQILAAFADIESAGKLHVIKSCAGTHNARFIKTVPPHATHTPSNHAFGSAIDLNSEIFPHGHPDNPSSPFSLSQVADIFAHHGFKWGQTFPTKDPMHFEGERFTESAVPIFQKIALKKNGVELAIPAFLLENTVWVGARAFTEAFNGQIVSVNMGASVITVTGPNGTNAFDARTIGGTGFIAFRSLNTVFGLGFAFDAGTKTLTLS